MGGSADFRKNIISKEELAKHKADDDCWLALNGVVYDITEFLPEHPGSMMVVLDACGGDATTEFNDAGHSETACRKARKYAIGVLEGCEATAQEYNNEGKLDEPKTQKSKPSGGSAALRTIVPVIVVAAVAVCSYFLFNKHK
eukprot:GDKI01035558.1.p2 GENE.GDKI01035558.1~~GDKI01035558.1.p2  ORF type:complete len:142 (-),score=40.70 GDKI01035558.1:307-732(-)